MLELYQFDFSPFCIKIRAILNIKDVAYKTVEIVPLMTQYKVRQLSGQSRVPVLKDGRTVIADSSEIAIYLDTAYPEPRLIPEDYDLYRDCYLWEDWADEVLPYPIRALAFDATRKNPALGREQVVPTGNRLVDVLLPHSVGIASMAMMRYYGINRAEIKAARGKLERHMEFLTGAVANHKYLVGDRLTVADISVAAVTRNLDMLTWVREVPRYQAFFRWRDRILAECKVA